MEKSNPKLKKPSATARRAPVRQACAAEWPPQIQWRGPTAPTRSRYASAPRPWERPPLPRCRWYGHHGARERAARRSQGASGGARKLRSEWWMAIRVRREWQGWSRTSASGACHRHPPASPILPLPTRLPPPGKTPSPECRYMWGWTTKVRWAARRSSR